MAGRAPRGSIGLANPILPNRFRANREGPPIRAVALRLVIPGTESLGERQEVSGLRRVGVNPPRHADAEVGCFETAPADEKPLSRQDPVGGALGRRHPSRGGLPPGRWGLEGRSRARGSMTTAEVDERHVALALEPARGRASLPAGEAMFRKDGERSSALPTRESVSGAGPRRQSRGTGGGPRIDPSARAGGRQRGTRRRKALWIGKAAYLA